MPSEFTLQRRVEFHETDMAGLMHFSNFFRWMEAAEHAFFRSLGFSIHMTIEDLEIGWPRVDVQCKYISPLRFEDEVAVTIRVRERRPRTMVYDFEFRKLNDPTDTKPVALGSMTTVCVALRHEDGGIRSIEIPPLLADLLEPIPSEQTETGN
jgi:YbgC/YbaW family acyl-CoA thioester hydrolase